jgi:hypothetical protein
MARDQHTVAGHHEIRLNEVGTLLYRDEICGERVLRHIAARTTMCDYDRWTLHERSTWTIHKGLPPTERAASEVRLPRCPVLFWQHSTAL